MPWVCRKCKRIGDFEMVGSGFLRCRGCGTLFMKSRFRLLEIPEPSSTKVANQFQK